MSDKQSPRMRRLTLTTVVALALTTMVSTAVLAGHEFDDVPNTNQFHGSISWMADNGITVGCNDAGDEFCPDDNVRRETMSSFMRRFAQTFGAASEQVTTAGASTNVAIDSVTGIEVASITVTPKAEANVTLNAHVQLEVDTAVEGRFEVEIVRGACDGEVVGASGWRGEQDEGAFPHDTVPVTGFDVVTEDTTYVLCVSKGAPGSADGNAIRRGLVANWAPTA